MGTSAFDIKDMFAWLREARAKPDDKERLAHSYNTIIEGMAREATQPVKQIYEGIGAFIGGEWVRIDKEILVLDGEQDAKTDRDVCIPLL